MITKRTLDQFVYILAPADNHSPNYPTENFRTLKANEIKSHDKNRTRRLVLEA